MLGSSGSKSGIGSSLNESECGVGVIVSAIGAAVATLRVTLTSVTPVPSTPFSSASMNSNVTTVRECRKYKEGGKEGERGGEGERGREGGRERGEEERE